MAAVLVPPTKSAHLTYVIYAHPTYEICPSDLQKMPIWPTKNAHPTYEKCPSDLRKMPIQPTKSAHLSYKIDWPSNQLQCIIFTSYCAIGMTKAAQ